MRKFVESFFNFSFSKGSYSRNFALIFSSKIFIVIVVFATTPIISRIYQPDDYGLYAVINSIVINITLLSNMSLPYGIVVAESKDLKKMILMIIQFSMIISTAISLCSYIYSEEISEFLEIEIDPYLYFFIPLFIILISSSEILAGLNIRKKEFKKNVIVNMSEVFGNKSSSLTLGFLGFTQLGLVISDFFGKLVNNLVQYLVVNGYKKKFKLISKHLFDFKVLKEIRMFKDYPLFQLPSIFISKFSGHLIIWIFAIYFTKNQLGYYSMAISLLSIPLNLFANSFQPIVTRKLMDVSEDIARTHIFMKILLVCGLISIGTYITIYLTADWFINLYLGEKWKNTIPYIQILCFSYVFLLIGNSISGAYIVFKQQKLNFTLKLFFSGFLFIMVIITMILVKDIFVVMIVYTILVAIEEIVRIFILKVRLAK